MLGGLFAGAVMTWVRVRGIAGADSRSAILGRPACAGDLLYRAVSRAPIEGREWLAGDGRWSVRIHERPQRSTAGYHTLLYFMYKVGGLWSSGRSRPPRQLLDRQRMQQNGQMTEPVGRPAYQQVADDLRQQIASGELPVGSAIPSTAKLSELYSVSVTVVRAAVTQLRTDGLVVGHPGKGVFVSSTPDAAAERTTTVHDLARQVAALREQVAFLQTQVTDLYGKLGEARPVPH